jgi:hypothetical protein
LLSQGNGWVGGQRNGWLRQRDGWLSQISGWLRQRNGWLSQRSGWLSKRNGWLSKKNGWLSQRNNGWLSKRKYLILLQKANIWTRIKAFLLQIGKLVLLMNVLEKLRVLTDPVLEV